MSNSNLVLATGGPGMVKAAYSSGKPAIGVGPGNVPAIIHETADIKMAVSSVVLSKTFDNGMICASEQSVIVMNSIYEEVKKEFVIRGAYVLNKEEIEKVKKIILVNGNVNAKIVGQTPQKIGEMAGIQVPDWAKLLVGEVQSVELEEPFSHEKLSPVLAMYKVKTYEEALTKAERLVELGGFGHTSSLYINTVKCKEEVEKFSNNMKTGRTIINMPSAKVV